MKVAVVVQRYGADINGGAELHARYVAEHLARHAEVEVLTSCAQDYITWANVLPEGEDRVNGIRVRRFPVSHPRDPQEFGAWSKRVFEHPHSVNDELAWLEAEGPAMPSLIDYLRREQARYDVVIFFSLRYHHTWHGIRAVPGKAVLVPTAERDEALGLAIFPPVLRAARAVMFNSPEERAALQAMAGPSPLPGVVVGIGSEIPDHPDPDRFRRRTGLRDRFAIYVGRIDENKGCRELFDFWSRYSESPGGSLHLVLIGNPVLPVPKHPRIHHLGFVSDREKFDAMAAADLLVMPSYFESLSMVALEAWALGKPVLANGRCDVLRGQAIRSNAALYYESYPEFREALRVLSGTPDVAEALGRNGREFFRRHYAWPVIERKYLDVLRGLTSGAPADARVEPLPGWWGRRRRVLPPARDVLVTLPSGPASEPIDTGSAGRRGRAVAVSRGGRPADSRARRPMPGRGRREGQAAPRPASDSSAGPQQAPQAGAPSGPRQAGAGGRRRRFRGRRPGQSRGGSGQGR